MVLKVFNLFVYDLLVFLHFMQSLFPPFLLLLNLIVEKENLFAIWPSIGFALGGHHFGLVFQDVVEDGVDVVQGAGLELCLISHSI